MKQRKWTRLWAVILVITMVIPLMSCGKSDEPQREGWNTEVQKITCYDLAYNPEDAKAAAMDFSIKLFQDSVNNTENEMDEENVLIAPTSVLAALAMTANGAENDTLAQMEATFGVPRDALNSYMKSYLEQLHQEQKSELYMANSIWIKDEDGFTVNKDFIEINKACYDAEIFEKEFDKTTLTEINDWVKKETKGLIEEVLNEIPEDAVMYLINALAFEAEWEEIYKSTQIRERAFTLDNGIQQEVEFMYSQENKYLEDELATGFIKYYTDKKYAFAALLPKENTTLSEYVDSMSGTALKELLENSQEVQVNAAIPKFEIDYNILMNNVLERMGMIDVFDGGKADLSGIGRHENGNLYVDRVIHKTHIEVDERGTKAGAVTVVEVMCESAMETPEIKTVYLDRPFVYMIIDCESNQPVFMGTVNYIEPYTCSLPCIEKDL